MVVVVDEGLDLDFEITLQVVVVFKPDPVLKRRVGDSFFPRLHALRGEGRA
jgi:hypothetical protein